MIGKNKYYAMVLDNNAGVYYGAEIKEIVLIDVNGDALVKLNNSGDLRIINIKNIFDNMYTLYLKLQIANKN
jgi:hypothetical protein